MQKNEHGRERPADEQVSAAPISAESPGLGPFISAVGECAELLASLKERVDDHLGISPDSVTWGHVADARRILLHLRQAAFVAGVGEEPA